jgi:catechol 2,3-dioxygenase-like lactoylglutathione lyase family enzyme
MSLVSCLKRVSIIVKDLNRSLHLYRDTLGLNVTWETFVSASDRDHAVFKLLGITPVDVRAAFLVTEDAAGTMIGLIELSDPNMQSVPQGAGKRSGELSLIFNTSMINELHERLIKEGVAIISPPTLNELPGYTPSYEMTLRDPDGVFINFIQAAR